MSSPRNRLQLLFVALPTRSGHHAAGGIASARASVVGVNDLRQPAIDRLIPDRPLGEIPLLPPRHRNRSSVGPIQRPVNLRWLPARFRSRRAPTWRGGFVLRSAPCPYVESVRFCQG